MNTKCRHLGIIIAITELFCLEIQLVLRGRNTPADKLHIFQFLTVIFLSKTHPSLVTFNLDMKKNVSLTCRDC